MTILGFGGGNFLRLVSNLILTRLLFPEAFGLMAIVQVFLGGLQMFSDIGIKTSIIQSARGDDPDFLNTAWTLQIVRGFLLWLAACAMAWPAARIYDEPMLLQLLPVVGLTTIVAGFTTTKIAAANRHLQLGRQVGIDLGTQAVGIVIMVILAWIMRSVWALVIGSLITAALRNILLHRLLPGVSNRFRWDPVSAREMIRFGKYIFLATAAGFLINQGDRAILGAFIPLGELGVYSVGMFLGTLPFLLGRAVNNNVVQALYRMKPPAENAANRAQIHRARRLLVVGTLAISGVLSYGGIWLTNLLYDPRYHLAGPMIVLFGLSMVPQLVFNGYGGALLSNGDSRRHFQLLAATALIQTALMFLMIPWIGVVGAILAPGFASLATYPMKNAYTARYKANDLRGDITFLALGFVVNGLAVWLHWPDVVQLLS
ncbi:oligosaccharide flippase family protein [Paracoccus sp. SY]|uniref:oligosaccharide flippase family protein n=1 Tax=Paracoccus sp. SY TaxID=1330255 RepID=UPI001304819D|nr:oligosaccharide flippase family protein [Paracoccus sp. SY]